MEKKLTIIIPFYNCSRYIKRCVENIKKQSSQDFYCIFVDDGSNDKSDEIAVETINDDSRFSLVRLQKNMGVGYARIKGIEATKTEYLTFMDIDDSIDNDAVSCILDDIKKTNADLYVYDYNQQTDDGKISLISDSSITVEDLFLQDSKLISHLWHKIFKKDLLLTFDISFLRNISFAEDLWLCVNCFLKSKKTEIIHRAYYYYLYNSNSLVRDRTEKSIWDGIAVLQSLHTLLASAPYYLTKYINDEQFHTFGILIMPNPENKFQRKPHYNDWRKLDAEQTIELPQNASILLKIYINAIRKRKDAVAWTMHRLLYIKKSLIRLLAHSNRMIGQK